MLLKIYICKFVFIKNFKHFLKSLMRQKEPQLKQLFFNYFKFGVYKLSFISIVFILSPTLMLSTTFKLSSLMAFPKTVCTPSR